MELRFGEGFSQVRIHTGTKASASAAAVNARAYTVWEHPRARNATRPTVTGSRVSPCHPTAARRPSCGSRPCRRS
jgi:hypothetical protein